MFLRVIEKATGTSYRAEAIDGGYQIYETATGKAYKKVKESTFKRYFKQEGEEEETPEDNKATEEVKPDPEPEKAQEPEQEEETAKTELTPEKREKMIDKIKKMLALAENNPSQEEALSAALQAQKLMAKYNIHEDDVTLEEIKDEIDSVFSTQKHDSSFHSWRKQLALIVAKNFRCKCYLSHGDVVFRGYKQDAKIALEVYMSLYAIGDKLGSQQYHEQLAKTGSGKGVYNSFTMGFLSGIEEAFNVQCTALMIVVPKEVDEEYKQFSQGFGKSYTKSAGITDAEVYHKGKIEGREAVKSRSISEKGKKA